MTGVVIALDSEAEAIFDCMEIENIQTIYGKPVYFGKAFEKEILVVVCGVGKANAAAGTCAVIAKGADTVLNFGTAGGLNESTEVGEVYLIERAVQYDFDLTQLNGGKIGTLNEETENYLPLFTPANITLERRALGTGDRFNDSPADHALLTKELGADVRDMEGAAVAQICKSAGIPCVVVKAISDVYGAGSTTEQFAKNLRRAMLGLKAELGEIFSALD